MSAVELLARLVEMDYGHPEKLTHEELRFWNKFGCFPMIGAHLLLEDFLKVVRVELETGKVPEKLKPRTRSGEVVLD